MQRDQRGDTFVLKCHQRGLTQQTRGFGVLAAIESLAGLRRDGQGAAGFCFTIKWLGPEDCGNGQGEDGDQNNETPSAQPSAPTRDFIFLERVTRKFGRRFGAGGVFGMRHEGRAEV